MWMFGLDNEEQHIFTFCDFITQKLLHQHAGEAFDHITTSVIIILPTLLCVLVQQ